MGCISKSPSHFHVMGTYSFYDKERSKKRLSLLKLSALKSKRVYVHSWTMRIVQLQIYKVYFRWLVNLPMYDTYSYPIVRLILLILVEKWSSNIIAHYDVFVAIIYKEKWNTSVRIAQCSLNGAPNNSPGMFTTANQVVHNNI